MTSICNGNGSLTPPDPVAVISTLYGAAVPKAAVPEISPVVVLRPMPEGNAPAVSAYELMGLEPVVGEMEPATFSTMVNGDA